MDDVIPIFHGERTFAPHLYCHGDVVVGTIDVCVPNAIILFLYYRLDLLFMFMNEYIVSND